MNEIHDGLLVEEADALGGILREQQLKMATVESCTGGWIAKVLTDTAGSSDYFQSGLVTYSNAAKHRLAGVSELTLEEHGAVSQAVVREMVRGTLARTGADVAVAVSGVAGPDGGSEAKPVGTVWFAWGRAGAEPGSICEHFDGDRDSIRRQAVLYALRGVQTLLQNGR